MDILGRGVVTPTGAGEVVNADDRPDVYINSGSTSRLLGASSPSSRGPSAAAAAAATTSHRVHSAPAAVHCPAKWLAAVTLADWARGGSVRVP